MLTLVDRSHGEWFGIEGRDEVVTRGEEGKERPHALDVLLLFDCL